MLNSHRDFEHSIPILHLVGSGYRYKFVLGALGGSDTLYSLEQTARVCTHGSEHVGTHLGSIQPFLELHTHISCAFFCFLEIFPPDKVDYFSLYQQG